MSHNHFSGVMKSNTTRPSSARLSRPPSPPISKTTRASPTPRSTVKLPQNTQVTTYISNLQGQIHLLEMETKMLKEKVATGAASRSALFGGEDDNEDVDQPMRELRILYKKLEEDLRAELEVCTVRFSLI